MKITYDLEFLPERGRTKDRGDLLALKAFLAGKSLKQISDTPP